jgi:hypothetical protein
MRGRAPNRPTSPIEVSMSTVRTLTLADAVLPRAGVGKDVLLIAGASLVTAAAAQLAIPVPWSPVPITGQTFAVLEALTGQLFLVVAVGKIISSLQPRRGGRSGS